MFGTALSAPTSGVIQKGADVMTDEIIIEIIQQCRAIDQQARDIYGELAESTAVSDLSRFWAHMASEESEHVAYWDRLLEMARMGMIPIVFESPFEVRDELASILEKSSALLERSRSLPSTENAFILAYRMEFYLLHPAFVTLFHYLKSATCEITPEDRYEVHLNKFVEALREYGSATPEMELLGETIGRLWKENRMLALQSHTDYLTKLFNRRGLLNALLPVSHLAQRNGYFVGVLMIDIDHFKRINDACGHQAGDRVLEKVAALIKSRMRASDLVGRYGGEEFLVFLSDVNPNSVYTIAEELRSLIEAEASKSLPCTPDQPVSVSIGAAGGRLEGNLPQALDAMIKDADAAMYQAKHTGRNKVCLSDSFTAPET